MYQSQPIVGVSDNKPVMLMARPNFMLPLCGEKLFREKKLGSPWAGSLECFREDI